MFRILFILLFFALPLSSEILLKDYKEVAIATDLEPDDVLALKLIFQETKEIRLIVVGEGNSQIKKMRMEKLLQDYFGADVPVFSGRSTEDNLFPYDGEELFDKSELEGIPFEESSEGENALQAFLAEAEKPLIIQLKPAPELLSLPPELTEKTTVLFYGSFNLRKTGDDLQTVLDQLADRFLKVGIVESYGVLGEESAVYDEYPWTHPIKQAIEESTDPFMEMFRKLVENWNRYLLEKELAEENPDPEFIKKLSSGLQFTLSDVEVALALSDPLFTATPVTLSVSKEGYLQPVPDEASNVFYYERVDREKFAEILIDKVR